MKSYFAKRNIFTGNVAWNSYFTHGLRNIGSNTGKSARQGNLRHPRVRFQSSANDWNLTLGCRRCPCLALFAGVWFYFSLLSAVFSFVFVYVLLADDHVNNVCYYVIIWLIVRICVHSSQLRLIPYLHQSEAVSPEVCRLDLRGYKRLKTYIWVVDCLF